MSIPVISLKSTFLVFNKKNKLKKPLAPQKLLPPGFALIAIELIVSFISILFFVPKYLEDNFQQILKTVLKSRPPLTLIPSFQLYK